MPASGTSSLTAAGLFAGIGGLERGLARSGIQAQTLVENWEPAKQVLRERFGSAELLDDIASVRALPKVDVLTAGFPCTDLSQAGRMEGIDGTASGLVRHVFRLLPKSRPTWLVFENVRNMLALDRGRAMQFLVDELEERKFRWAYRLVDSRSAGVPQRRQRVLLVASRVEDPSAVLFGDEAGEPNQEAFHDDAFGFYWTEGVKGLGWARDALPTLKGGSTVGIPSPPAVWIPNNALGRRLVTPSISEAEALQGFPRGWTEPAAVGSRNGPRWKLVGNAVTVGVSEWLGKRLVSPAGSCELPAQPLHRGSKWPRAAYGGDGKAWTVEASMWPESSPYQHLLQVIDSCSAKPLSGRAAAGFLRRTERSKLRFNADFLVDVKEHVIAMGVEAAR